MLSSLAKVTAKGNTLTVEKSDALQESVSANEEFQQLGSQLMITEGKIICLELVASDQSNMSQFAKDIFF